MSESLNTGEFDKTFNAEEISTEIELKDIEKLNEKKFVDQCRHRVS